MAPPRPNPPIRPHRESRDDLAAVAELDAAEARARAAMRLVEEEAERADAAEEALATMKAAQTAPFPTHAAVPAPAESVSPGVTLRGKHWKFTVPISLIVACGPLIWALISDYMQTKRDLREMKTTFDSQSKSIAEVNTYAHEVARSNAELRETVAQLSGYLAGVLPKAGVKVPGAQPGATPVEIIADPLPAGEKRQRPVNVHTLVPAPAPK